LWLDTGVLLSIDPFRPMISLNDSEVFDDDFERFSLHFIDGVLLAFHDYYYEIV
jgi:hypothetical protein